MEENDDENLEADAEDVLRGGILLIGHILIKNHNGNCLMWDLQRDRVEGGGGAFPPSQDRRRCSGGGATGTRELCNSAKLSHNEKVFFFFF